MGIEDNPMIRHEPYEKKIGHTVYFIQADGLPHTIYKDKHTN